MVAGHLREKDGYYHIVLCYTDEFGVEKEGSFTFYNPKYAGL